MMSKEWWSLALALFLVCAGGALSSCGDDGSNSSGTPVAPTEGPVPNPTIEGNLLYFPARGYKAEIPQGWEADPNALAAGPLIVDAFFSEDTVDGVQSNIGVTCERQGETPASTEQFVQNRREALVASNAIDLTETGQVEVSGEDWSGLTYNLEREGVTIHKREVFLASDECGWTIALTTAPSRAAENQATFEAFLQSFAFIPRDDGGSDPT